MTGGLAVAAAGVAAVGVVLTGAGWLVASSLGGRGDLRSVMAQGRFEDRWAGAVPVAAVVTQVAERSSSRVAQRPFRSIVSNPLGGLAQLIPKSRKMLARAADDSIVTGSLGSQQGKRVLTHVASADPAAMPTLSVTAPIVARATPMPPPLPQPRPRLASIAPMDGLKLEDDRTRKTAIYDITAQLVYLPNGQRLEAHSGLGDLMDDPRYVDRKNRGATPPNTYDLKLRESLFHGVQAIRLTPVGDSEMYGRDGILAHSFMLGQSGQSNGCVSFRDYHKFLEAFQRGEIDRMIVVTHRDKLPTAVAARSAPTTRRIDNTF